MVANDSLCFVEFLSSTSAEKLRTHLQHKKVTANFTSPSPNPFRTMPKETPHRQTSPPAQRGGYTNYNDRGGRGAYTRGRGNSGGGYGGSRGGAYQVYGGYRGRGGQQQQRQGGYSQQGMQPVNIGMNMPFGKSPSIRCF